MVWLLLHKGRLGRSRGLTLRITVLLTLGYISSCLLHCRLDSLCLRKSPCRPRFLKALIRIRSLCQWHTSLFHPLLSILLIERELFPIIPCSSFISHRPLLCDHRLVLMADISTARPPAHRLILRLVFLIIRVIIRNTLRWALRVWFRRLYDTRRSLAIFIGIS